MKLVYTRRVKVNLENHNLEITNLHIINMIQI